MKIPTLSDVANAAGVSYATADRVINKRGNVAEKSVRKVEDAVSRLGYVRNVAAANLSRGQTYRLAFLIPKGRNAFFQRMHKHLESMLDHLAAEQISVEIFALDAFATEQLAEALWSITGKAFNGVAVVGLQSAEVEAPLKKLHDQGTAVVGLVSDLPATYRATYIGINNIAAGRTAGRLVGLVHAGRKGRVLVLAGSMKALDHKDRIAGFCEVVSRDYPNIEFSDPVMTRDDAKTVKQVVLNKLQNDPAITAIYNVGAGNSGLIAELKDHARPEPFFCIVHELVDHSIKALEEGQIDLVIDQRPDVEINRALTILRALIDERPPPPMPDLVPTIYVRDNLPSKNPDLNMKESMS